MSRKVAYSAEDEAFDLPSGSVLLRATRRAPREKGACDGCAETIGGRQIFGRCAGKMAVIMVETTREIA